MECPAEGEFMSTRGLLDGFILRRSVTCQEVLWTFPTDQPCQLIWINED